MTFDPFQRIAELEEMVAERDRRIAGLEWALAQALAIIDDQQKTIVRLTARIEELEAKLSRHSGNSSIPPSANPPGAPKLRGKKPTGRKPGGQPGHPGRFRAAAVPDEVIDHLPVTCTGCATVLPGTGGDAVAHQVTELPPICVTVTEHRLHRTICPSCGQVNRASLPPDVPLGQFGPRFSATVAGLSGRFRLSRRETAVLAEELFGTPLAIGSVQAICERASEALAIPAEEVGAVVLKAPVIHADETGFGHRGSLHWLWTVSNQHGTLFQLHPSRGQKALGQLIPATYGGVVVSDRWAPYERYEFRALCHAHLLRNWTAISERKQELAKSLGKWAVAETERLLRYHRQWRQGEIDRETFGKRMTMLKARYWRLLGLALECGDPKTASLARELERQWDALWTFVTDKGVEPTNNEAERAIRPAVLWRKGSFGTQSDAGQRFVERSLTVAATAKKQGVRLFDFLHTACDAHLRQQPPPSLFSATQPAV